MFAGLDGYRSIVMLEDALADNVLVAERLSGRPLDGDHVAPARLISPDQYGYINTEHLCRIELHTREPDADYHANPIKQIGLQILSPQPRARGPGKRNATATPPPERCDRSTDSSSPSSVPSAPAGVSARDDAFARPHDLGRIAGTRRRR